MASIVKKEHFLTLVQSDDQYKISLGNHFYIFRDDRTGVNYLKWVQTGSGANPIAYGFCPLYGADGKPLVTDEEGNIPPEQKFMG